MASGTGSPGGMGPTIGDSNGNLGFEWKIGDSNRQEALLLLEINWFMV